MKKPLIIAFLFFSRLPMPRIDQISVQDNGRSLLFLPLVGLTIGLLLYISAYILQGQIDNSVLAALVLTLWCGLTGGLHLDGLADSADAWLSGANKEKSLEVMKDPRCGTAAIVTLGCVLLIKFSALSALLEHNQIHWLVLVPVLGRVSALILFLTTPYVRSEGLAKDFSEHAPKSIIRLLAIFIIALTTLLIGFTGALWVGTICAVLFYSMRKLMLKRLGGSTGDTSGALIEVIEAGVLVALI